MAKIDLTDEEFWIEFKDVLFAEEKLESSREEVEKIVKLAGITEGSRILDMPCGIGRHSKIFNEMGFDVVGVDKTFEYIEEAREKTDDVEFVNEDMKDFKREESFDVVVNWWNSFGYFENKEDDQKMLENIHSSLKENGVLVMDYYSKEIAAIKGLSKYWSETDGLYNMHESRIIDDWKKVENTWIKVEDGETAEYVWEQRLYSASKLEEMLEKAGFAKIKFYGNVAGEPFDENADRLTVVAQK